MEKILKNLIKYCKQNHVEINISPDSIELWSVDDKLNLTINDIHPSMVESAVDTLNDLRIVGWKMS